MYQLPGVLRAEACEFRILQPAAFVEPFVADDLKHGAFDGNAPGNATLRRSISPIRAAGISTTAPELSDTATGWPRRYTGSSSRQYLKGLAMLRSLVALVAVIAVALGLPAAHAEQTIVFLRHGEKPLLGLGQLDCQGFNRALALPPVLLAKFGKPDAIYAPNPGFKAKDKGVQYNYLRPLATIEPTAIRLGLPVNTEFGLTEIKPLEQHLLKPGNSAATIYVAWEHNLAQQAAQQLIDTVGGQVQVPDWAADDYDSLYEVRVKWLDGKPVSASFKIEGEGLNHQSMQCPGA